MEENLGRVTRLTEYVQGLMNMADGKELYIKYRDDIERVTPQEAFGVLYNILQKGKSPKEILIFLDKVINVFYKSLTAYPWKRPEKDSFIGFLMQENRAVAEKLDRIKDILKEKNLQTRKNELLPRINELSKFNQHYLKKENILFPFLEKKMDKFNGLAIMWSLHDEIRGILKKLIECLEADNCVESELNAQIGSLFFAIHGMIQKEELILFPAASEVISDSEWDEMQRQSLEYEFPFIERPEQDRKGQQEPESVNNSIVEFTEGFTFKTETGELNLEQLILMLNALPIDLTFVDENNRVKYFTRPKDRIFPRSPAVIGRDVDKCHPPESVHVVHKIIDAFRSGKQDTAAFWIDMKGKMVLIQYFALRNSKGEYKGVLEASQDITEIKKLEGERRLLRWEDE